MIRRQTRSKRYSAWDTVSRPKAADRRVEMTLIAQRAVFARSFVRDQARHSRS